MRRPGSEDSHQRERKFFSFFLLLGVPLFIIPEGVGVGLTFLHGLLSNINIRIPIFKKVGDTPYPYTMTYSGGQGGYIEKLS